MLFQGQYWFRGTHADKVKKLTAEFDSHDGGSFSGEKELIKHPKLFQYVHEVYQLAPVVGFLYKRKADENRENGSDISIFAEQMSTWKEVFQFNYNLIMLLDAEHEADFDARVDKAFRHYGTEKALPDEALYESYVRGGIDVLYEKLIEPATSPDDYTKNLYEFMEEFENRYGQSAEEVLDLCRIARS
jgi:hypothetical protein